MSNKISSQVQARIYERFIEFRNAGKHTTSEAVEIIFSKFFNLSPQTEIDFKPDVPCQCGQCEEDDYYYECKGCLRTCPYCFGGSGEYEDYCDDCWLELSDNLITVLVR